MDDRKTFLIAMYNQICQEMDRHIKIIWQIVGVLLSTFAIFALVEKDILSLDIASSIILAVCGLALAIIVESNFWYNRNLVIVANIERQFLLSTDSQHIHYYFTKHRKNNAYIDMMLIQIFFVIIIAFIILTYHFNERVLPNLNIKNDFSLARSIPYLVVLIVIILICYFNSKRKNDYNTFKSNSPGKIIDDTINIPSNTDHKT